MIAPVTGGASFIGSWILQLLQAKAAEIRLRANLCCGKCSNLHGLRCTFINASISFRTARVM